MTLLLDTCLSGKTADMLRASGHDVVWAGSWSADPGDVAILARARDEPHCGIVRLVDCAVARQAATCEIVLARHGESLVEGGIVTAEPGRLRFRPPADGG